MRAAFFTKKAHLRRTGRPRALPHNDPRRADRPRPWKERAFMNTVVTHRRALHRIPELGFELPETLAYVEDVLKKLPCTLLHPAKSCVCAYFDAQKPDTLAFRADMDALPVTEATGAEYASCHPGKMHACGHDGHSAMLLGFAEYLAAHPEALSRHNALLIFQPAEETTGGAKPICDSGILQEKNVSAVFGIHLQPGLAAGLVATRPGPLMAQSNETTVTFFGKSAHIAKAAEGADAAEAAARFLCASYDLVATASSPTEPRLLKFGRLEAGTVRNALAAKASLLGSLRCMQAQAGELLQNDLLQLANRVAARYGCTAQVTFSNGYPPVVNDPALFARVQTLLQGRFDLREAAQEMTSEDFSFYGEAAPALFFRLGTGTTAALHAADFNFDDETILPQGTALYAALMEL